MKMLKKLFVRFAGVTTCRECGTLNWDTHETCENCGRDL
ncbi:hypothetical protein B4088_2859 [Bacillus cereus]|uniref:RanBP2-type domain-containing protein n=1 Tax=Bacillus cereus TaxID=1396 RepID=A0A164NVG6_BACCE|nr:hypothetical protein B4088_2859 [Bacillus cereus]